MPSPFPGVDPYIEAQGRWQDFHHGLLAYFRDSLNGFLPDAYVALVEESMRLVREPGGTVARPRPDASIARDLFTTRERRGAVAVLELERELEPVSIPLRTGVVEEVRESWIEILKLPELSLVTVLEVLSPTNKAGAGRVEYLEKRDSLIARPVHIVELDLLIAG